MRGLVIELSAKVVSAFSATGFEYVLEYPCKSQTIEVQGSLARIADS